MVALVFLLKVVRSCRLIRGRRVESYQSAGVDAVEWLMTPTAHRATPGCTPREIELRHQAADRNETVMRCDVPAGSCRSAVTRWRSRSRARRRDRCPRASEPAAEQRHRVFERRA